MNRTEKSPQIHQGRNVKRLREMQEIKRTTLASQLGGNWTQEKVSELEAKETIETGLLQQVAQLLQVSPEIIQKLKEETTVNIISNNFTDFKDHAIANTAVTQHELSFNPIEKMVELYERLIQAERDKNEWLKGKLGDV